MNSYLLDIAAYIGIIAYSITGARAAIEKKFNFSGTVILAIFSVVGGGVIRDIAVNHIPVTMVVAKLDMVTMPAAILNPTMVYVIVVSSIITYITTNRINYKKFEESNFFVFCDACGLVSFAIIGAIIAIKCHLNLVGVTSLAVITAIGGGVIRDIIIKKSIFAFAEKGYSTIAAAIGIAIYFLHNYYYLNQITINFIIIISIIVRILVFYRAKIL